MNKYNIYADSTYEIVGNMEKYGGSFVKTLAALFYCADATNRSRIITTWEQYFDEYKEFNPNP